MRANVQSLFDFGDYGKRKLPTQQEFEEKNRAFLLWFEDAVYSSHENLFKYIFSIFHPYEMDRNMPAVSMMSFLKQKLVREYPAYCRTATRKRFKLVTPSEQYIYVKKLDDDKKPSNIQTYENDLILNQSATPNDNKPNIFVGYTATEQILKVTGVYAVCIDEGSVIWHTDISLLRDDSQGTIEPIEPQGGNPTLKPGVLTLRKNIQNE